MHDLEFASASLTTAKNLGRPDAAKIESKALIFAGVMAYARPFSSSVRSLRLDTESFASVWAREDITLHDYLMNLRNKHVAHSVNEFERCDPIGVIVLSSEGVRKEDVSGVGATFLDFIGLSAQQLDMAIHHIQRCIAHIKRRIDDIQLEVHTEMKIDCAQGWTMAPILRMPDDDNVGKARPKTKI